MSSIGSSWHLQHNIFLPRSGFYESCASISTNGAILPQLADKTAAVSPLLTQSKEFSQKNLMLTMNKRIRDDIKNGASMKKDIIMQGRTCKGASFWLTTPPNIYRKTTIDAASFRMLIKYSAGMELFSGVHTCLDCGKQQDNYGHHALSCRVASGAIDKHNSIVHNIFSQMKNAGITCSKEAFNPLKDTRQRPGDIYMPEFDIYGEAYFDVSVISICAPSYAYRASKGVLEGSKIRYDQKMTNIRI